MTNGPRGSQADGEAIGEWVGSNDCVAADGAQRVMMLHGTDGRLEWVGPGVRALLGYRPNQLIGVDAMDLVHPDERDALRASAREALARASGRGPLRARLHRQNGGHAWCRISIQPLTNLQGRMVNLIEIVIDSDATALETGAPEESLYQRVLDAMTEGIVVHDTDGTIRAHNPRACEILGLPADELVGRSSHDRRWNAIGPDGAPLPGDRHPAMLTLADGEPRRGVIMGLQYVDGWGTKWLAVNSEPILLPGAEGVRRGAVASFHDVTEHEEQRQRLRLWEAAFSTTSEAIVVTDASGLIVSANAAFAELCGCPNAANQGKPLERFLVPDEDHGEFDRAFWSRVAAAGTWQGEATGRGSEGAPYRTRLSITAITDVRGRIANFLCIASDISEQKRREEAERYYAEHDVLTGLANRRRLYDRADLLLRQAKRSGTRVAVLYIDLNSFKPINDRFGHETGDTVLHGLAQRLSRLLRDSDTIARVGGDELVVLLPDIDEARDAEIVAEKLNRKVARPFDVDDHEVTIGASIGIAIYPEAAQTTQALIDAADRAMYRAKRAGDGSYAIAQ
jgi:diguanylate cyclase (GGDEF)-like protein/PAS domain S-box-containing protein